jgi:hypothetical protein
VTKFTLVKNKNKTVKVRLGYCTIAEKQAGTKQIASHVNFLSLNLSEDLKFQSDEKSMTGQNLSKVSFKVMRRVFLRSKRFFYLRHIKYKH